MNTLQRNCLIAFALVAGRSIAQVPPCTNYQGDFCYGSLDRDVVNKAIGTGDGNVVMVGRISRLLGGNLTTTRYGGAWDALIFKVAPDGSILWSKTFGGDWIEDLMWVTELPGGDLLAAGYTQSTTGTVAPPVGPIGNDGWYMRLDADGNELWNKRFRGIPTYLDTHFSDGALTADGAILLNGNNGEGIRIDLDGNVLSSSDLFHGQRITAAADGTFLIARLVSGPSIGLFAGEPAPLNSFDDVGLVNVNADATVNWVHRFVAPSYDYCTSVLSLPDGYVILSRAAGEFGGDRLVPGTDPHERSFWLVRTDLAGDIVWERSLGGDEGHGMVGTVSLDSDGGLVVVGTVGPYGVDVTEAGRGDWDGWVFKVDALGTKLWDKRWGGSLHDQLTELVHVPSGYLLVGYSSSPRSGDHHHPGFMRDQWDIWIVQMYPGLPGQWYPDSDADGFGDACCPMSSCDQPTSYASNPWDCQDFDFPNFPDEYLGAPCNDGDWHTIADMLEPGCLCAGTFVDPADLTPVSFTLWPDFDPGQTTWELRDMATQQIAMQGGPYPNGQQGVPESSTVLIPPVCNQRFQLFVFDAGANGMQGGRYTLTAGGKRLIDSDGAFQQVSTVSSQLLPIDVPVGDIGLTPATCDRLDLLPTSVIIASEDLEVSQRYAMKGSDTGYQFWIFDPHGSYSRRVFLSHKSPGKGGGSGAQKPRYLRLSSLLTQPVPQNKLLNVRVRSQVQGVYGPFGPACTMKIDPTAAACPVTQLINSPNDPHNSCGMTFTLGGSERIWAYGKPGVNLYQFQFADPQTAFVRNISSSAPTVLMSVWNTQPLQPLHVYAVRVRCSLDGGASWCVWGPSCTIYTAGASDRSVDVSGLGWSTGLTVFPNPATEGTVRVRLAPEDHLQGPAELLLTDVAGRSILRADVDVSEMIDGPMELRPGLVPGTYMVSVSCNGLHFHERFVVE